MSPSQTRSSRRGAYLLVGLVVALGSAGLIGGGAYGAIAAYGDTYVDLGAHGSYHTERYALVSDRTNWQAQMLGWAGHVRLEVASASDKPIFVGVAPAATVDDYLSGTSYTTVDAHSRADHDGAPPAISRARTIDWTAHAVGSGVQTLRWHATKRPQIVLAMNADGSRLVRVRVVSSAVTLERMPWWVPASALVLGATLLPLAVVTFRGAPAAVQR